MGPRFGGALVSASLSDRYWRKADIGGVTAVDPKRTLSEEPVRTKIRPRRSGA